MGSSNSSEEETEIKGVDSNGNVNNNVIVQAAADTHHQMQIGEKLLFATYLLVAAEVLKFGVYLYHGLKKTMKKKYQTQQV